MGGGGGSWLGCGQVGLWVFFRLGVWGVIAVAAAWPMGTQTPLVTQALTMIIYTDDGL